MLKTPYSQNILLCIFFLSGLGLIQVYSSSYIFATENYNNGLYFFNRQLIFTLIGFFLFFVLSYIPWRFNRYLGLILWFFSVMTLMLTLIPKIGVSVSGSSRWLQLPLGFRFQPSELLKVTTPFIIAYLVVLKETWPLQKILFWMIPCFALGFPMLILILQPDFGTIVLLFLLSGSIFFVLGLKWRYVVLIGLSVSALFYGLIKSQPYRFARWEAFLNPWQDPTGKGFQVIQSLLGIHSGGLFGTGIGKGQSKLFFLPEAHTDFTLSVLGEEMGFLGLFILFLVYGVLVFTGFKVVLKIYDEYQKILAFGLVFIFSASVVIHSAVNLGLVPTKGLVLPFLSYGGSSLICTFLLFGWLMSLERDNQI